MRDCDKCLHSRMIISENGFHSVCCLPSKQATDCLIGKKSQFATLERDEDGHIKVKF